MASAISRRSAGSGSVLLFALWLAPVAALSQSGDEVAQARPAAVQKLEEARLASEAAKTTEHHPDYLRASRNDGEIAAVLGRARRLLESAEKALETAESRPTPTAFRDAGFVASGALREFGKFERQAQKALARIEAARRPPPPPPPASPPPPPRAPSKPPSSLNRAADAFFAGNYQGTIEQLFETRFRSNKAKAHSHLLRAAARYTLFLLAGESDYALRSGAIEDIQACRRADPALTPHEEIFSPRFRQFFTATE